MRASADLAAGPMTVAMPANTPATPAMTRASAVNAKASERAVTATAMAATLSTSSPTVIQMITTALRMRPTRLIIIGISSLISVSRWRSLGGTLSSSSSFPLRSAQEAPALLVQREYAVTDGCAGRHQAVGEDRGQGDEHHGSDHVRDS